MNKENVLVDNISSNILTNIALGHSYLTNVAPPQIKPILLIHDYALNVTKDITVNNDSFSDANLKFGASLIGTGVCTFSGAGALGATYCGAMASNAMGALLKNVDTTANEFLRDIDTAESALLNLTNNLNDLNSALDNTSQALTTGLEEIKTSFAADLGEINDSFANELSQIVEDYRETSQILNSLKDGEHGYVQLPGMEKGILIKKQGDEFIQVDYDHESSDPSILNNISINSEKSSLQTATGNYQIKEGRSQQNLEHSDLTENNPSYLDNSNNIISDKEAFIEIKDNDGNFYTAVKENIFVPLANGTKALTSSIIEMGENTIEATQNFMNGYVAHAQSLFTSGQGVASMISDISSGLEKGNSPEQIAKTIATKLAIKQLISQGSNAIKQEIRKALLDNVADKALVENGDLFNLSSEGVKQLQQLESITNSPSFEVGYAAAISFVTNVILNIDEGWDSEEYTMAAVEATAQASAQIAVSSYFGASSAAAGVGAGVAHLVSASIRDIFADDSMNSHQWQSTIATAGAMGVAAWAGSAIGVAVAGAMAASAASAATLGMFLGPIGAIVAVIIVTQFMGGKEYEDGEYPDPYSFLKIVSKEDGSGNTIYGIEKEGVVAFAREHYHDDIIGTNGNDILVGRNGTNLLIGNGGDDLIEGRGDTDQIKGGDGNDIIEAGNENDHVQGDAGNDLIYGDGGDDILLGGLGNDIIYGGIGNDRIEGNEGDDIIYGQDGNDIITAGTGNDTIDGGDGDDTILGEAGNDNIDGGSGNDTIEGNAGNDILIGNAGNDSIKGGDGDDEIYGNLGVDILYGDAGSDIINGGNDNDLIFGGIGNDIVYGGNGDDAIYGEIGNDYVIGGQGNDILDGFDGDDVLFAGKGNDTLDGGRGLDSFIFKAGDGQDVITDIDGANDIIKFTDINSSQVTLTKDNNDLIISFKDQNNNPTTDKITITNQLLGNSVIETLEFNDGKKIDLTKLTVNSDSSTNYITENYSNVDVTIQSELAIEYAEELDVDVKDQVNNDSTWYDINYDNQAEEEIANEHYNEVQWRSFKKKRSSFGGHYTVWYKHYEANIKGTNGNDRLVGNWWSENLYGEGGDDQLYGNNGNDIIYGQDGNDYINGGADNDVLSGGAGHDKIDGGVGNDNIDGGTGNDTLNGQFDNDTIYGRDGDDFIDGGDGNDILEGNIGNDTIFGQSGNDNIKGGEDNDLIIGHDGNDNIAGNSGNDTIYGRKGNDVINGGSGDDYISGGSGYDIINGDGGNDIIYGNGDIDVINGGDGNDNIYGGSGNDQLSGNSGNDKIFGGSGTNSIFGNDGDDTLTGGEDYDKIEGNDGNDTIFGRSGGDEIHGGAGNDIISGGQGNDILTDGLGNDNLIGGSGKDIFIVTKNDTNLDEDVIEDFDKNEDRIIIKVDYKKPITFSQLQSKMSQNGSDTQINLENGQKITIKNVLISDLTSNNIAIGLAGGENNDILFGENGDDVLFGESGDDNIYGGSGNDELWGGIGSDALYGEAGDDILRYEADRVFAGDTQNTLIYFNENETNNFLTSINYEGYNNFYKYHDFVILKRDYYENHDISYKHNNLSQSSHVSIRIQTGIISAGLYSAPYQIDYHRKYDYKHYFTTNYYDQKDTIIDGYNHSLNSFNGGTGTDVILMTQGDDVIALDDPTSQNPNEGVARLVDISVIYAGDGNDVINLTSPKYNHGNIVIYGGNGDDKIWSSIGDDTLFGGSGEDEIFGGNGHDVINGGEGNDVIFGGNDNDNLSGGSGNDQISGEAGDDIILGGVGADILDGGEGEEVNGDTISYSTSSSGVTVNIANNTASSGDAAGDTISNFENITGSNFADNLTGDENDNIITGGGGDDVLTGGGGSDTYIYNIGDGNDTITDDVNNHGDKITLDVSIKKTDLLFEKSLDGKDLIIKIKGNDKDSLIIKDQLVGDSIIEEISFNNGNDSAINLENKTILGIEDSNIEINLDEIEQARIKTQNISIIAAYGSATYNENNGLIFYIPNANFNGIEELSYNITDENGNVRNNKINLMISPVNDNPFGTVAKQEIMVDEKFSLNLNDYFSDVDGDNLTYLANVKDQEGLPHWITLDEKTGTLSGIFGRDGKITIELKVQDGNGGIHNTSFDIAANVDLSGRVIDIPELKITNGTTASDNISAIQNQQDLISTGAGDDEINYVQDNVWADTGNENFFAWNTYSGDLVSVSGKLQSFDSFDGGAGNDTLNLTNGNDVIFLDDPMTSALSNSARISGIETINGGLGDDIIDLSSLNYEYGDVTLNGGDGNDVLWSNSGNDTLNGGDGNDNLQAGTGNDILNGDGGDDILKGYDGNETLNGGVGADILTGGNGADSFNFTSLEDSKINQSDLITDFTKGEDSINFSGLGFTAITEGEGSGTTLGYSYDQEKNITTIDDVNSDFELQLSGKIILDDGDFNF